MVTAISLVFQAPTKCRGPTGSTWGWAGWATTGEMEVRRVGGQLAITLIAQDIQTPTREARVEGDTLSFVFNEPEAGVLLTCALARQADERYAGRCVDAEGKWTHFTMTPPEG